MLMGFMDRDLQGCSYGLLRMKCLASWVPGFRGLGLKEFDAKSSSSCKQVGTPKTQQHTVKSVFTGQPQKMCVAL